MNGYNSKNISWTMPGVIALILWIGMLSFQAISAEQGVAGKAMLLKLESVASEEAGLPTPDGLEWYRFANHTHSEYSHDSETPVGLLIWSAGSHGAKSISITDHRTMEACLDPHFQTIYGCTPICGEEWGGGSGHAGLINMEYGDPMEGWTVEEMIPEALSRGATIIVNHPFDTGTPWPHAPFLHEGIRGIEIWNGPWVWIDNQSAVNWWQDVMAEGRMVFGIGGSDVHYYPLNPLLPCNYVLSASSEPDDIQAGVDAGRISISMNEKKTTCFMWCDSDLNGSYETVLGDNIAVQAQKKIRFKIEIFLGEGLKLNLHTSQGNFHSRTVGSGNPWTMVVAATVGPQTKDFLRLEVRKGLLGNMWAITNPIFVNY